MRRTSLVDGIEYPGLFAEDVRRNAMLPPLIGRMVAIDAFSQAFTNPLLSPRVFNAETFSPLGWNLIRTTRTLSDLVHRNVPDRAHPLKVTMTRSDWSGPDPPSAPGSHPSAEKIEGSARIAGPPALGNHRDRSASHDRGGPKWH